MRRTLIKTTAFMRAAKKILKRDRWLAQAIQATLELLEEDAFHPNLKTHKLKGNLSEVWACGVEYDLRILFTFVQHEGSEAILLEAMGTHDEVY